MNRELSFLSRLILGRQATVEGSSPERESRLDTLRSRGVPTPRSGSTPRSPKSSSAGKDDSPRRLRAHSIAFVPVLTQDTDIDNFDESLEIERLNGNLEATRRLRDGQRYDFGYARKLATVD
jgi:hypothetical protein